MKQAQTRRSASAAARPDPSPRCGRPGSPARRAGGRRRRRRAARSADSRSAGRAPRRSSVAAPRALPRRACVSPTASCARPCHRSRSAGGAAFHAASRTSCAWNGQPSVEQLLGDGERLRRAAAQGRRRPAAGRPRSWAAGVPSPSRGLAFRARPAASRSRPRRRPRVPPASAQARDRPARTAAPGRSAPGTSSCGKWPAPSSSRHR